MQIMMHRIFPGHVYLVNVILLFGISMPLLSFGNIIGKIVFLQWQLFAITCAGYVGILDFYVFIRFT